MLAFLIQKNVWLQLDLTLGARVKRLCGVMLTPTPLLIGDVGAAVKIHLVIQPCRSIHLILTGTFTGMKDVHEKSEKTITISFSLFHDLDCASFRFTLIDWLDLLYLVDSN